MNLPIRPILCVGDVFSFHTGTENAVPSHWPMYFVIQVSTAPLGKVLNQIQWKIHANAIGDVDMFGSNQNINSTNFNNEALFTWLGRTYFGGFGSGVPFPSTPNPLSQVLQPLYPKYSNPPLQSTPTFRSTPTPP